MKIQVSMIISGITLHAHFTQPYWALDTLPNYYYQLLSKCLSVLRSLFHVDYFGKINCLNITETVFRSGWCQPFEWFHWEHLLEYTNCFWVTFWMFFLKMLLCWSNSATQVLYTIQIHQTSLAQGHSHLLCNINQC